MNHGAALVMSALCVGILRSGCLADPTSIEPEESQQSLALHWSDFEVALVNAERAWTIHVAPDTQVRVLAQPMRPTPETDAVSSSAWSSLLTHDGHVRAWGDARMAGNSSAINLKTDPTGTHEFGPEIYDPYRPLVGNLSVGPWAYSNLGAGHHHLAISSFRSMAFWHVQVVAEGAGGFAIEPWEPGHAIHTDLLYPREGAWRVESAVSVTATGIARLNATIDVEFPRNKLAVFGPAFSSTSIEGPRSCSRNAPYGHFAWLWDAPVGRYDLDLTTTPPNLSPPYAIGKLMQFPGHEGIETRCT